MRKVSIIAVAFVMLFLFPVTDIGSGSSGAARALPMILEDVGSLSEDMTGSGQSLPVVLSGEASNIYDSHMVISSGAPGTTSILLSSGWTATGLSHTVQGVTTWMNDQVLNWNLDKYHNEKWLISPYQSTDVQVPDSWTLTKTVSKGNQHPRSGYFRFYSDGAFYYSGIGWRFEARWSSGNVLAATDEIYLAQQIAAPFRAVYSARVTFWYNVRSISNMDNQVHLFVRLEGSETKLHVFESGDTTETWLQAVVDIPSSHLDTLSFPSSLLLEVGLATDLSGSQSSTQNAYVYVDEIQLQLEARPFPEQIGLKANGTAVVGGSPGVEYEYVPDVSGRDCHDDPSSGLDLDGYNSALEVGIYGSSWSDAVDYEAAFQIPLDIPKGSVILSAYFEAEPTEEMLTYVNGMRVRLSVKTASSGPITSFTTGLPHLEDRYTWIPAGVDWMPTAWYHPNGYRIRQRSPDITALVQEAVSDPTWSSGNYVAVMLDYIYSSTYASDNRIKGTYGYGQSELARLCVEYLVPYPEDAVYTFTYQKDIVIDHTKVAATLTDFPVLIDLFDADLKTDAQADGDDIAFKMGDTPLDFEIESFEQSYNSTHAHLVAWVKIPSLSSTTPTTITMMYGNPNAPPRLHDSVWADYEFVHHLADSPSGTIQDSSPGGHHGTSYGSMTAEDLVSGAIGKGLDFDGTDDMVSIGQVYT
ncbi:MAG: DUF2341 domain-containing protein, partial [Candidatus Thorarchaeota archaeon]|nr:DUF2341 domain-containing protein [Candidatus Thorarchaeota archaeon]